MNVFDAWLIIVGLAIGAGLAWLVMLDLRRREDDIAADESRAEAAWIADTLRRQEIAADPEAVEEVLRLHRAYLAGIPEDGKWAPAPALAVDAEAYEPGRSDVPPGTEAADVPPGRVAADVPRGNEAADGGAPDNGGAPDHGGAANGGVADSQAEDDPPVDDAHLVG